MLTMWFSIQELHNPLVNVVLNVHSCNCEFKALEKTLVSETLPDEFLIS